MPYGDLNGKGIQKKRGYMYTYGLPGWCNGKKSACQCKRLVRSLGQKDPLEEEMVTHSSILAWKIPWTEESAGLQFMRSQRVVCD